MLLAPTGQPLHEAPSPRLGDVADLSNTKNKNRARQKEAKAKYVTRKE